MAEKLQEMLDNAFNDYDLYKYFGPFDDWTEFDYENCTLEQKIVFIVFNNYIYGTEFPLSDYWEKWLNDSNTDLKLLELVSKVEGFDLEIWTDNFFQKNPEGISEDTFFYIVNRSDDAFKFYGPFSNSGILHWKFIEEQNFKEYLELDFDFDPFIVIDQRNIYQRKFIAYDNDCLKKLVEREYHDGFITDSEIDFLSKCELTIYEYGMLVDLYRYYQLHYPSIGKLHLYDGLFNQVLQDIEIMKIDYMTFSVQNTVLVEHLLKTELNVEVEYCLIMSAPRSMIDKYFTNFSKMTIDNVIKEILQKEQNGRINES